MEQKRKRRPRANPFEVISRQLEEANNMQQCIKKLLPNQADDALMVELRAIRGAFDGTTQALKELQALLTQVLGQRATTKPVTAQELIPEDDKRGQWHAELTSEFGPANDGIIRKEIDRLWAAIQNGAPHPGDRAMVLLKARVEQQLGNRLLPTPGPQVPRLAILDEEVDNALDEK